MKRKLDIIKKIVIYLAVGIILVSVLFLILSITIFGNSSNGVFGYKGYIVLSDSMQKTDFAAGDLIFVKKVSFGEIKVGDIISYTSTSKINYGETVTHKIRSIVYDEAGNAGFITYWTTSGVDDEGIVTYPYIIGKYQFKIPKIGYALQFLKTIPGYVIFVMVPFFILIILQVIDVFSGIKLYRNEQLEELRIEREQLENERKNLEEKIEELRNMEKSLKKPSKRKVGRKKTTKKTSVKKKKI